LNFLFEIALSRTLLVQFEPLATHQGCSLSRYAFLFAPQFGQAVDVWGKSEPQ